MELKCLKCGQMHIVKNGIVFGKQRYKCQNCGYQFTKTAPAGKPVSVKLICHQLYVSGFSMRQIASIVGVTPQSVSRWLKKWHLVYMSEIGNKEVLYHASKENLFDCIDIQKNDKLVVSNVNLPSGAKMSIIINLH